MVLQQVNINSEQKGDTCYYSCNYTNALCWYNRALKKDPKNITLLTKKGNTLVLLKKESLAYDSYVKVLIQSDVWGIIDDYINRYSTNLNIDIQKLKDHLVLNYQIPITQTGLFIFLQRRLKEIDELKRIDEWKHYRKTLNKKPLVNLEAYVNSYLNKFGERFYIHFWSFYCYLSQEKGFSITTNILADIIVKQRQKLELMQFARMLKRPGGRQHSLDKMSGVEFEDYLMIVYEEKGYIVKKTQETHDYGADLIAEKFGEIIVIQAKRIKKSVGIKAIQEVSSAKNHYNASKAIVITTSTFTDSAKKLADSNGVELWDRKRLLEEINKPWF